MSRPAATPRPLPVWIGSALLVMFTGLLYSRSLGYGFINYDDPAYVTNNPQVQAGLTWAGIKWAFAGHSDYWHPLTWVSHMADWQLFGSNAAGHRAVNIAWHAANAVLVFLLGRRLLGSDWLAWFSAALFAWHPLRVESVVWVTERKDVMSGAFFLLTLLAWLDYGERLQSGRPARRAYVATLGAFFGGLMCKPSLVTAPVVLLLLDFWPLRRLTLRPAAGWWATHRCVVLEKLPFLLLSGVIAIVTIRMQAAYNAFVLAVPLADRAGNAVVSIARYLGDILWPADLALFYEHPGAWPWPIVVGAVALVALITAGAWRLRDRAPWLVVGWVWFVTMLLPMLGLLQVGLQSMADRFTYLPILGFQLALLGGAAAWPVPLRVKGAGATLVLAACAGLTWHQQGFWRDSVSVYQRALAVDPRASFAEAFLAYTYEEAGDLAAAETHARRAIELRPSNHWALVTLANVQGLTGRAAEAVGTYQRLLDFHPDYARGHTLRGLLLQQLGRLPEAETNLARAAELTPESPRAALLLAEVRARQRKFNEAATAYEKAIALDPASAEAHAGLGYMAALTGRREQAAQHWKEALRLQPNFPGLAERLKRIESAP